MLTYNRHIITVNKGTDYSVRDLHHKAHSLYVCTSMGTGGARIKSRALSPVQTQTTFLI